MSWSILQPDQPHLKLISNPASNDKMATVTNFLTVVLLVMMLCPAMTSATYAYRRLRMRKNPRQRFKKQWKSSGLFLSKIEVQSLQMNRTLKDLFLIETSDVAFPLEGPCGLPSGSAEERMMAPCSEGSTSSNLQITSAQGCCTTIMDVEIPQTVTSIFTGLRHQVLQFAASSQLVHTGRCDREGGQCVLGGTCVTFFRIQWLLVRGTPLAPNVGDDDSGDDDDDDNGGQIIINPTSSLFVPAMVANHCQCVFS